MYLSEECGLCESCCTCQRPFHFLGCKMQTCRNCKINKEFSCFYKNKLKKTGFDIYCNSCEKIYYNENREKISNRNKLYRQKNKQQIKARMGKWRANNRDKIREEAKVFYKTNKERLKLDRLRPKTRYSYLKSVAKRRKIPMLLSYEQFNAIIKEKCFFCNVQTLQIESGGGLDRIDSSKGYEVGNVLSCCKTCNVIKSNHSVNYLYNHLTIMLNNIKKLL